jgi:hypothetical protein
MGGMSTRNEIKARLGILAIPNATLGGSKRRFAAAATPQQVKAMLVKAFNLDGDFVERLWDVRHKTDLARTFDLDAYDDAWKVKQAIERLLNTWRAPLEQANALYGRDQMDQALAMVTGVISKASAVSAKLGQMERDIDQILAKAKQGHEQRKRGRA